MTTLQAQINKEYLMTTAILSVVVGECIREGNPTAAYVYSRILSRFCDDVVVRMLDTMGLGR